jgi:choline transport protein
MTDLKQEAQAVAQMRDSESQKDNVFIEKKGTAGDQNDMYRMGKQQELRRNFRFMSIFSYSMVLMATWETVLTSVPRRCRANAEAADSHQDVNYPTD